MKKRIVRFMIFIIILLVLFGLAMGIYLSNYYHADKEVIEKLSETCNVSCQADQKENYLIFLPKGEIKAGFIFYPGGKVEYTAYAHLMQRLAEKGIFCILLHVPGNIAFLEKNAADGIKEKWPDISNWYLGGHSLGGVVAEMYLSEHQTEYCGLVLLASYGTKDIHNSNLRILLIYGENDEVLDFEKMEENAGNLPSDTEKYMIPGGNHAYFGHYGEQTGDGKAFIDSETQCLETAEKIIDWIEEE